MTLTPIFVVTLFAVLVTGGGAMAAPAITVQPEDATTNVGGAASFRVVAGDSSLPRFQWVHEGKPLVGATRDVLVIARATVADAGRYAVQVIGAAGNAMSTSASLTVQPAPTTPIVDSSFLGDPTLTGSPTALLPLADGRVLLATSTTVASELAADPVIVQLTRLLHDGRIDPSFRRGVAMIDEFEAQPWSYPPRIGQVLAQTDGKILVAGHFIAFNGVACPGLVRLMADGQVDPSFRSAVTHARRNDQTFQIRIALQPDGKILVLSDDSQGLVRLQPGGQIDPGFSSSSLATPTVVAVTATGRIFVGSGQIRSFSSGRVTALRGDGTIDSSFPSYICGPVVQIYSEGGGGVWVTTEYDRGPNLPLNPYSGPRFSATTFRLRSDGAPDSTFPLRAELLTTAPAPDGSVFLGDKLIAPDGVTETAPNLGVVSGFPRLQYLGAGNRLWVAGTFSVYNGVSTSRLARLNLVPTENLTPPRILAAWAEPATAHPGEPITLRLAPLGPGPLTYTWTGPGWSPIITNEPSLPFLVSPFAQTGNFSVTATNSGGSPASASAQVSVVPGALRIVDQPHRVSLVSGRAGSILLKLAPTSASSGRSDWRRDGVPVQLKPGGGPGAVTGIGFTGLGIDVVEPAHAGTYTVTLADSAGQTVTSDPIVVTVDDDSRFTNLSTRAAVGSGEQAAILGFSVPTGQNRTVLLRGIGPSLANFGVAGALAEARLDVFDAAGRALIRSNSWGVGYANSPASTEFAKVGAFALPDGSRDGAVVVRLGAGSYTARLSGMAGATGVGLIELYETDNASDRLTNLSSRILVRAGANAIAGFAIRGPANKRVLMRVAGPALTGLAVAGALADPRLDVRDGAGRLVAANDDWQNQSEPASGATVSTAAASVGAFAFANGSKDAALVVTLPAGNYSAVVTGTGAESGVALVEVYELP